MGKLKIGQIIRDSISVIVNTWCLAIIFCVAFENGWLPSIFGQSSNITYDLCQKVRYYFYIIGVIILFVNGVLGKYSKRGSNMRYTIQLEAANVKKLKAIFDKDEQAIVTITFTQVEADHGGEE